MAVQAKDFCSRDYAASNDRRFCTKIKEIVINLTNVAAARLRVTIIIPRPTVRIKVTGTSANVRHCLCSPDFSMVIATVASGYPAQRPSHWSWLLYKIYGSAVRLIDSFTWFKSLFGTVLSCYGRYAAFSTFRGSVYRLILPEGFGSLGGIGS